MKGFRNLIKRIESRDISPLFTATYPLEDILLHSVLEKKHSVNCPKSWLTKLVNKTPVTKT
jgi:hypothetical protein